MRWFALKEGYKKKPIWVNIDQIIQIRFGVGSDGQPLAYLSTASGEELSTHDTDDLEKLERVLHKNSC
jgi:hypothetical protein